MLLDLFVFWQSQYILTRANECHDQRSLESRLAQRLNQHAIRCAIESFEVVCYLRPAGDGAIVTRRESEHGFGDGTVCANDVDENAARKTMSARYLINRWLCIPEVPFDRIYKIQD